MRRSNFTFKYIPQRIESKDLNIHLYISVPCIQHDSQQLQGGNNPSIHHWVGQTMLYIHTMDSNGLSVTVFLQSLKKKQPRKSLSRETYFLFPSFLANQCIFHFSLITGSRDQRPFLVFFNGVPQRAVPSREPSSCNTASSPEALPQVQPSVFPGP